MESNGWHGSFKPIKTLISADFPYVRPLGLQHLTPNPQPAWFLPASLQNACLALRLHAWQLSPFLVFQYFTLGSILSILMLQELDFIIFGWRDLWLQHMMQQFSWSWAGLNPVIIWMGNYLEPHAYCCVFHGRTACSTEEDCTAVSNNKAQALVQIMRAVQIFSMTTILGEPPCKWISQTICI